MYTQQINTLKFPKVNFLNWNLYGKAYYLIPKIIFEIEFKKLNLQKTILK